MILKVESRSAVTSSGLLYVMTPGILLMLLWPAGNLISLQLVYMHFMTVNLIMIWLCMYSRVNLCICLTSMLWTEQLIANANCVWLIAALLSLYPLIICSCGDLASLCNMDIPNLTILEKLWLRVVAKISSCKQSILMPYWKIAFSFDHLK